MPPSATYLKGASFLSSDEQVSWNEWTVQELKSELKNLNLPVSGAKKDLILRLENHHQTTSSPPTLKASKYFSQDDSIKETKISPTVTPERSHTPIKRRSPRNVLVPTTPSTKIESSPSITSEQKRKESVVKKTKSPSNITISTPSPNKRPKIEPGSLVPPQNWEKIYALVEELRSDRSAPVDTEGGEALPEKHLGPEVFRFQVLTALMLSSQTKDAIVGETMRALQKHGLTVNNIHNTDHATLNSLIGKVGFHNNKTKFMKQAAEIIISQYNGDIPPTAEEMMKLPGVGPKMAYIVENIAFGSVTGIGVDTHMHRMFNDLKWVNSTTPEQTREQLEGWLPKDRWREVNWLWVGFGQEVQQQKEKMLQKILKCSSPREGLRLVKRLRLDVTKEARRFGLEEEIKMVLNDKRDA